jgi:hypothetical protein
MSLSPSTLPLCKPEPERRSEGSSCLQRSRHSSRCGESLWRLSRSLSLAPSVSRSDMCSVIDCSEMSTCTQLQSWRKKRAYSTQGITKPCLLVLSQRRCRRCSFVIIEFCRGHIEVSVAQGHGIHVNSYVHSEIHS